MAHSIPQSKRPRQSVDSEDLSTSSSSPEQPTRSARRTDSANGSSPFLCTLPPTCINRPTPLQSSKDMEIHYAKFHAHVCASPGCSCVFPDEHLLNLHHTECHDPISALRKDRGERIFSCFVPACGKLFQTPKSRRLHLIEAHKYPKEYFFAVTNKGVGGLLQKWGEGASMIRGPWKAKQPVVEEDEDVDSPVLQEEESESEPEPEPTPRPPPEPLQPSIDDLANSMTSLSIVPNSIRFGRGGKTGGFADKRGRGRGAAVAVAHPGPQAQRREADMDVDVIPVAPRGGRGGIIRGPRGLVPIRGRGRARGRARGSR